MFRDTGFGWEPLKDYENRTITGIAGDVWLVDGDLARRDGDIEYPVELTSLALAPADWIVAGDRLGKVHVLDLKGHVLDAPMAVAKTPIVAVAASPTQHLAAVGTEEGLLLVDLSGVGVADADGIEFGSARPVPDDARNRVKAACVAVDEAGRIATGGADGTVQLWTAGGEPIVTLGRHDTAVKSVAFGGPGEEYVKSTDADGTVRVWRAHWKLWLDVLHQRRGEANAARPWR